MDKQKHIMVVEDESNLSTSLYFILASAKYQVSLASNGKNAFAMIQSSALNQNPVDLLITDVIMPEMDGEQLLALLRKHRIHIPALIMTGYGDKELAVRLLRLGCNDFLDKPFEPEIILQRVESILNETSEKNYELKQKEHFAGIGEKTRQIAHDLNNILSGMFGYTDMAMEEIDQNHPAQKILKKLQVTTNRAAEICLGLLSKTNDSEGACLVTTEINSLTQRIATVLKDIAPKDICLSVNTPEKPLWLRVDGERLQQAILNLGFNAFKAMPEGGTLSIAVSCDSAERAKQPGAQKKCVVFTIEDTGTGIAADTIGKIFDKGFTTCEKGHGMGLSCVRKIIEEEHGGWINVTSELGKGTIFNLYIPCEK
jgi:signal transduction histidine kinase